MSADRHDEPPGADAGRERASATADVRVAAALDARRLLARAALVAAVVVLATGALLALPALSDVRERLRGIAPEGVAAILVLELLSSAAFVLAFREVLARRRPWRLSRDAAMAALATNVVVPTGGAGGLALAGWALTRAGVPAERVARRAVAFFLLTSMPNFATAAVAGTLLALGLAAGDVPTALAAVPAGLAVATMGAVALAPRGIRGAARRGRLPGRWSRGAADAFAAGVADARALLRRARPPLLAGVLGFMAFDVLALAAAFVALADVPPVAVLALAYVLGQLGGLVPTPGGVGGTDGGLIGALVLYGTPLADATAAVLAYRAFQLGVPVALGLLAAVRLPRTVQRSAAAGASPWLRAPAR